MTYKQKRRFKNVLYSDYQKIHYWVTKQNGKATQCSVDKTHLSKRYEWAHIGQEYKYDINDFVLLCLSCHRKNDFSEKSRESLRLKAIGNGWHNTPISQIDTNTNQTIKTFSSVKQASQETNTIRTAISNCLNGRAKTAGGYTWRYQ